MTAPFPCVENPHPRRSVRILLLSISKVQLHSQQDMAIVCATWFSLPFNWCVFRSIVNFMVLIELCMIPISWSNWILCSHLHFHIQNIRIDLWDLCNQLIVVLLFGHSDSIKLFWEFQFFEIFEMCEREIENYRLTLDNYGIEDWFTMMSKRGGRGERGGRLGLVVYMPDSVYVSWSHVTFEFLWCGRLKKWWLYVCSWIGWLD